jgi:hypothetical protein
MMDWIISLSTITYMYLLSEKKTAGWYLCIVSQLMWTVYIYLTAQWGLYVLNVAMYYMTYNGIKKWRKTQ